ncbi:uncharacterized protein T069G_10870 [Trichoderma breve]|uniref:Mg2+ transporter zinc transport protein n=1 Tax=Trichoderma breve TaxID=2034170 RepID=A0A9W9B3I7_9HYPO|nr:uncharacterized protein T069G_10870 [Trichoderma breve]KAJ4855312.1 hypothetical protein T069G_10870 [Trichoderma breve]
MDAIARNRETYASFGEDGLTATANAHGHLIQITRYFGNEPSGFICVDLPEAPAPYYVTDRMKELQRFCEDSHKGMKLQLPEPLNNESQEFEDDNQPLDDGLKWGIGKDIPKIQFYHDRWPSFIAQNLWLDFEVQYFISAKTVYQTYTFSSVEGMEQMFPKKFPPLIISANLLLRHLDFVTEENPVNAWNSHSLSDKKAEDRYIHDTTLNTKAIFIKHKDCETGPQGKKDAILFISPYIDHRSQSVSRTDQHVNYEIKIDEQAQRDLLKNKRVKVTLAYTLELASSTGIISSPLSEGALPHLQPQDFAYKPPLFADDKHLNFTLRRNLEHILSVCSIPISIHKEPKDEIIPIALTCGDISGHRITKTASFYAFQYLLKAFEHFNNESDPKDSKRLLLATHPLSHDGCENYNCRMRFRIWKTCQGHLAWISDNMKTERITHNTTRERTTEEVIERGFVAPHYWADGQIIGNWEEPSEAFLAQDITDAPIQIIKFGEYCRITGGEDIVQNIPAGFKSIATHWVESLHKRNKGNAYAFPRLREEETGKFYLADHALIWWASKSLEELGLESALKVQLDNSSNTSGQRTMEYSSEEIRNNFIKRFTMNNPASKTRMLAVSRSSAETRFTLSARESVLFYAMDLGLFDVEIHQAWKKSIDAARKRRSASTQKYMKSLIYWLSSFIYYLTTNGINGSLTEEKETLIDIWEDKINEWTNTVDYQTQLEDQLDVHWHHPLQFALSVVISAKNKSTNSRLAAQMFEYSRSILLESSSPNGLFPGQLDVYKNPILFDREIMRDVYWQATFEVPFILWKYLIPPPLAKESPIHIPELISPYIRTLENNINLLPGSNGNGIPNDVIDQGKVVKLSDEWLYNELDCFKHNIKVSEDNIKKLSEDYRSQTNMIVMKEAAQEIHEEDVQHPTSQVNQKKILGYIIDIPRKSDKGRDAPKPTEIKSIKSLCHNISRERTTKKAKKRLLHFCHATHKTALICYISALEHPDISTFFDRHKAYNKHFHEETNAVLNLWVTELHLSFYQIISQQNSHDISSIPDFEYYDFPYSKNEEAGNPKQISRAVMSFRFDGDFFDRHWTCHFFEFSGNRVNDNKISDITKENITGSLKAHPWKQRRVLELVFFGKILQDMVECSQQLLDEIKRRILESFKKGPRKSSSSTFLDSIDLFDEITSNMFISANKSWNIFQYILQVVEEDLYDNLTKIELWMKREERPEHNKPRWTLNDERNYRGAIYRLQKSNDLLVQDLRLCYTRAKSFNASLTKRLESTRGEWEVGSNDDIRLFTYVTVVFLPISFATGIFSTSSAPTKETISGMITTAGLALLVTVMTLLNAKLLDSKIVKPFLANFRPISEATLRLVLRSPLYVLGLLFRLAYLILISLLSILPGKWISVLRRYLISPAEESSSGLYNITNAPKNFLDKEIKGKNKQIKQKLVDVEKG